MNLERSMEEMERDYFQPMAKMLADKFELHISGQPQEFSEMEAYFLAMAGIGVPVTAAR